MDFDLNQTFAVLKRTPGILSALLDGLSDEWTQPNYGAETWSVHQVIGHLIWGERTDWMPRIRQVLDSGEDPPFTQFDRNGHAKLCRENDLQKLLEMFSKEREENLQGLSQLSLTPADLNKTGIHPAFGRVTIQQILATWTVHDLNHVSQICKALAFQYKNPVGPWESYLSILSAPNPR